VIGHSTGDGSRPTGATRNARASATDTAAAGTLTVEVFRGDHVESRHQVDFAFCEAEAPPPRSGAGDPVFLRSAAKPFQAAAVVQSGGLDRLATDDEALAIVAASHSGEPKHTALVERLLARQGLSVTALQCGVHPPFDAETAARLGPAASALHHNCSGKHAGMLAVAAALGAPVAAYLDPAGEVQKLMYRAVAAVCGLPLQDVLTAVDGCGAVTFAVPLGAAARAFARLARPDGAPRELRQPLARVAEAMRRHPHLIGGSGRFDTRLMAATGGRLLAKGGAEGVEGVADLQTGLGLCLKVRDGAARAVAPATLEILRQTHWTDDATLQALEDLWRPELTNHSGMRVGRIVARPTGEN
jgi:L-asparaginase II